MAGAEPPAIRMSAFIHKGCEWQYGSVSFVKKRKLPCFFRNAYAILYTTDRKGGTKMTSREVVNLIDYLKQQGMTAEQILSCIEYVEKHEPEKT